MGKELSTQESLNSFELINHKSNVYFWLHQVLDGAKLTKSATFENVLAAASSVFTDEFDQMYAALASEMTIMTASWIGDGTNPRTINLSGAPINTIDLSCIYSWDGNVDYRFGMYSLPKSSGEILVFSPGGMSPISAAWSYVPGDSTLSISLSINASGTHYDIFLRGSKYL